MALENLIHLRAFKVTGNDAKSFLQGQLSNDITQLDNNWQYNAYCTPKGRALATFITWSDDTDLYLLIDQSVTDAVIKRLRMYVMRSDVIFEELDAQMLGAFDIEATLTAAPNFTSNDNGAPYYANVGEQQHVLDFGERYLIVDFASTSKLENTTEHERWIEADVLAALPRVTAKSSEMFIPQMLNMDLVNGINFKKGCYTGQEIIARMRYLGKLKQRSFVCQINNDTDTSNISELIAEKIIDSNGKTVGNIANAVNDSPYLSAVLRLDNVNNGLFTESGIEVQIADTQPYSLVTD